ncbi:MAG: glycosyltransferase family 2 protein [Planctomycetota bacterium]
MSAAVDIVVVNWNAGPLLADCVRSVDEARQKARGWELGRLVVVDNASTDGSASSLPEVALVIHKDSNVGFARACNEGAHHGRAPFVLFLNPDTRLDARSIEGAVAFLESDAGSRAGIVGVPLVGETGDVDRRCCARAPTAGSLVAHSLGLDRLLPWVVAPHFLLEWDYSSTREVDQVSGAFFFMRRRVFEELAGFDERFFLYYEDVDLSVRAKRAGWSSVFLATTPSYHRGEGTTHRIKARRLTLSWRSKIEFARKHFGETSATLVALTTAIVEPLVRVLFSLARTDIIGAKEILEATGALWDRGEKPHVSAFGRKSFDLRA